MLVIVLLCAKNVLQAKISLKQKTFLVYPGSDTSKNPCFNRFLLVFNQTLDLSGKKQNEVLAKKVV